jgi:predicted peptidase
MKYSQSIGIAVAVLSLSAMLQAPAADSPDPKTVQTPKTFSFKSNKTADIKYLLFLPKGYEAQKDKQWPLVMFLHGAGERGTDIWRVAIHGPPKVAAKHPEFPFIIVSPQCPDDQIWDKEALAGLLDQVQKDYRVDAARVYLTGLSMGGYGTWDLGLSYPERFAAIAPICGGGNTIGVLLMPPAKREALKSLGIWVFHGAKDDVVPPSESKRMIEALKRLGIDKVKLTEYPEAGHDAWSETYNNPQFFEWLLEHKRQ